MFFLVFAALENSSGGSSGIEYLLCSLFSLIAGVLLLKAVHIRDHTRVIPFMIFLALIIFRFINFVITDHRGRISLPIVLLACALAYLMIYAFSLYDLFNKENMLEGQQMCQHVSSQQTNRLENTTPQTIIFIPQTTLPMLSPLPEK